MDKKLFFVLFFAFFFITIVGVLSHEFGHYIAARILGYDAEINYGFTYITSSDTQHPISENQNFLFLIGGPLQTMGTGTIGLILLYTYRYTFVNADKLNVLQWTLIFTTLFWLRQIANFCIWVSNRLLIGEFTSRGDEINIAKYLGLPLYSVITTTAMIGLAVLLVVFFKFIPKKQRLTFIVSGLTGGTCSYVFWIVLFGKHIMP